MVATSFVTGSIPAMNSEVNAASTTASSTETPFSWDNATVYFLLTDRFYNGDTSNDHSYGRGLDEEGNEVSYDQYALFRAVTLLVSQRKSMTVTSMTSVLMLFGFLLHMSRFMVIA